MRELLKKITIRNKELLFRSVLLLFLDMFLIIISMGGALWIRFDFRFTAIDPYFLEEIKRYICINVVCTLLINNFLRLYTSLWRFASVVELKNLICAVLLSAVTQILGMKMLDIHVPKSYPILYLMILSVLMTASRFSYRFIRISMQNYQNLLEKEPVRTMLIGAGAAGCMIANEIKNSKNVNRKIMCIIDDDKSKIGTYLQGIQVVGKKEKIPYYAKKNKVEEIIIAIPSLSRHEQKELLEICQKTSCKIMTLPGIYQLINEEVSVSMLQEVQIEDLLGREPIQLEMKEIIDYVRER